MEKHQASINILQEAVDKVISMHPDESKLCISVSIAIMGKNHEIERCELLQFGIKDALVLLLRESLQHTEDETDEFLGFKKETLTIN